MAKPCEIVKKVDTKKRVITLKKNYESTYLSLDSAKHCNICKDATTLLKSDKPHTMVDAK